MRKNVTTALSARHGEAPHVEAANQHDACSQCQRFENVRATANSAVEQYRRAPFYFPYHTRERIQGADSAIHLPTAMIGNDDGVHTALDRMRRIVRMQNPLQNDWNTRVLPQKSDVFPGERRIREQSSPKLNRRHGILLRRLRQQPAKNRVSEIIGQSLPLQEWQ